MEPNKKHKFTKQGYIRAWRICDNHRCNDWNDEPEKIVVPYAIMEEAKSGKTYKVVRMGWGFGKKQQHYIKKEEFYFSPEEAQAVIDKELQEKIARFKDGGKSE